MTEYTEPQRAPRTAPRYGTQPIGEAVTSAVDKSDLHDLDPKLVQQITDNVIKQLRQVSLQATDSPTQATSSAAPNQSSGQSQPAPIRPAVAADTRPFVTEAQDYNTNTKGGFSAEKHTEYGTYTLASPDPKTAYSVSDNGHTPARPGDLERQATSLDETPLEKIWGRLFDEQGEPTSRAYSLMRGLALHLIEDYEPKNSLVISPAKMVRYYRESKLEKERYPWDVIFDDGDTYVSRMYRELGIEHHLFQENVYERPDVPGLTPVGFSKWAVLVLLAHPEDEVRRLQNALIQWPISDPDNRKERYPKDLPKRLLPSVPHSNTRSHLRRAIRKHSRNAKLDPSDDLEGSPRSSPVKHPPPNAADRGSQSDRDEALPAPLLERERQPYRAMSTGQAPPLMPSPERISTLGQVGESAITDEDEAIPPVLIERERKPYYATPGGGGRSREESARGRDHRASNASASFSIPTSTTSFPPPPRQSSIDPSTGLSRSSSNRSSASRAHVGGLPPSGGLERGPPPAPSTGSAGGVPPQPEIHQQPPQGRPRAGSFTRRRRAPSTGRAFVGPGLSDVPPHVTFQPGTYDSHHSVYVGRAGGHDGYGPG